MANSKGARLGEHHCTIASALGPLQSIRQEFFTDDMDGAKAPPSQEDPYLSKSQTDGGTESSDDDDWFNKSLDDFDIPAVTAAVDHWSGEDEEEEEDRKDDKRRKTPGKNQQSNAIEASERKNRKAHDSHQKAKPPKAGKKKGKEGREHHDSSSSDRRQSAEDTDSDDSEEDVPILEDAGVALRLRPEESQDMQLLLGRVVQIPPEKEQSLEHEKRKPADCSKENESLPAHKGKETGQRHSHEDENPAEEPVIGMVAKTPEDKTQQRQKSDERMDEQEDMVKEARQKRHKERTSSTSKQTESGDQKGKENGKLGEEEQGGGGKGEGGEEGKQGEGEEKREKGGGEKEKGKQVGGGKEKGEQEGGEGEKEVKNVMLYSVVKAEEIPEEELNEEWFVKQLKELPTLFKLRRIHELSEARLRANLTMLYNVKEKNKDLSHKKDEDDVMATGEKVEDEKVHRLIVNLMKTTDGDYGIVEKVKWTSKPNTQDGGQKIKLTRWCSRNPLASTFMVVLKWLLGKRQEAEMLARHDVEQYPFSLGSVANLFYILWRKGERREAAQVLSCFAMLKKMRPDVYDGILCEEQRDLGAYYTELGPEFIPDAIATFEEALRKKPQWFDLKWDLALNLRRLTNARHRFTQSMNDIITPLLRATEVLLELIEECWERHPEIKLAAAAELGEILSGCEFDDKLKNTVGKRAQEAGWNAAKCFDMVMEVEDPQGSWMIRAGKFFRQCGQFYKSEKALKKAVAVQESPKAHHQLALTLKKLVEEERRRAFQNVKNRRLGKKPQVNWLGHKRGASQQNRGAISRSRLLAGDSHMKDLARSMKAIMYQSFSREDKYVNETMHHLNKAVMLSHGENSVASYDLGLMYKALGEYREALEQFLLIADSETDTDSASVVGAFEQSGLVSLEKCSLEENETRAITFQEDGKSLLTMAILIQSHLVQQFRETDKIHAVLTSCYTLGQYLQLQQEVEGVFEEDLLVEVWLLRLLRVYADNLPVLVSLQQFSRHDAENPQVVMDRLRKYQRDQRHEDVVLFTHLLHLTQQGGKMKSDGLTLTLGLRALVMAARSKLMMDVKAGLVGSTFNSNMAKRFFRWAFEEIHFNVKDNTHQHVPLADVAVSASPGTEPIQDNEKCTAVAVSAPATVENTCMKVKNQETGSPQHPGTQHETRIEDCVDRTTVNYDAKCQRDSVPENRESTGRKEQQEDRAVTQTGTQQLSWAEDVEEEEHKSLDYHMVLLYDPADRDAATFCQDLHRVLQKTCGLKTYLPEQGAMDSMQKATTEAMDIAHQLLFVIGCKETSPELKSYIQHANAKFSETAGTKSSSYVSRAVLSLLLSNASILPELLQSRPSLSWSPSSGFTSHEFGQTVKWVNSVCKLFCFLTGIEVTF